MTTRRVRSYLRHLGRDEFDVASAGTEARGVNRLAVHAMAEEGIDSLAIAGAAAATALFRWLVPSLPAVAGAVIVPVAPAADRRTPAGGG
jgi:hypothetical protein